MCMSIIIHNNYLYTYISIENKVTSKNSRTIFIYICKQCVLSAFQQKSDFYVQKITLPRKQQCIEWQKYITICIISHTVPLCAQYTCIYL